MDLLAPQNPFRNRQVKVSAEMVSAGRATMECGRCGNVVDLLFPTVVKIIQTATALPPSLAMRDLPHLTAAEARIFDELFLHLGRFVPAPILTERVLGRDYDVHNIRVAISRINRKFRDENLPWRIDNRPGVGYRLQNPDLANSIEELVQGPLASLKDEDRSTSLPEREQHDHAAFNLR